MWPEGSWPELYGLIFCGLIWQLAHRPEVLPDPRAMRETRFPVRGFGTAPGGADVNGMGVLLRGDRKPGNKWLGNNDFFVNDYTMHLHTM